MDLIFSGGKIGEVAAAVEIGLSANRCARGGLHNDSSRGHGHAVLVHNCDGRERGLRGCGAHQDETEKKSTHAVRNLFYVRRRLLRSVFRRRLQRGNGLAVNYIKRNAEVGIKTTGSLQ